MKRFLSVLLIAMLILLSGCTETAYSEDDVIYYYEQHVAGIGGSAKELANNAECVYEGTVTDISFVAGKFGGIFCLSTVYEVLVTDVYQGNVRMIEYVITSGGIKDYKVAEQIKAWHDAGRDNPAAIWINLRVPTLEIGETYIFFAGELLNDAPYKGYRLAGSVAQFAIPINDDHDLVWPAGVVTREDVYEHFGINPVLRTVLRIGFAVVIVAGVAVTTVLLIRRKKRKATPEETEQIPEET